MYITAKAKYFCYESAIFSVQKYMLAAAAAVHMYIFVQEKSHSHNKNI